MAKTVTILAVDFKPMLGGVAEYTFQLAEKLNERGLLKEVLTPNIQNESYLFTVSAPKEFPWIKNFKNKSWIKQKLYSLVYISQLRWLELSQAIYWLYQRQETLMIVNWISSPISRRWLSFLSLLQIEYAIILHGKDILLESKKNDLLFEKFTSKARFLIFNSRSTVDLFHNLRPDTNKNYFILYPGVDIDYFKQEKLSDVGDLETLFSCDLKDKLIISSVCRLVKRKGIDLAIKALEPILQSNKNLIYIIMGNGEEYETLQNLITSLKLNEKVLLVGTFEDKVKFSLLNASSIFIMPNIYQGGNDFEGFGISFLEASYFRNVVIGGRNGGVVEAIKDKQSGFLIDTDSDDAINSIREVVDSLLKQPSLMKKMAEYGNKYVVEHFQAKDTVSSFIEYIQENIL